MRQERPGRVLVLGGTGLIGGAISAQLLERGHQVCVLARSPVSADLAPSLTGAEVIMGDAADQQLIREALDGCQHVIHAVGALYPGESDHDPGADARITLPPVVELLESLRAHPDSDIIFLSSGGTVYGEPRSNPVAEGARCEPITSYGIMKLAAERYIAMYSMLYGVRARILRVANAYGPRQRSVRGQGAVAAFLQAAADGSPVTVFGDGLTTRDYVHVDDIAQAAVDLVGRADGPATLNVGLGVGATLLDVIHSVQAATGRELVVQHLPARPFDVRRIVLDVRELSRLIDWRPRGLHQGVADTWREFRTVTRA